MTRTNRWCRALLEELVALPEWLLRNLPGRVGERLRRAYWRVRLRHLGRGVRIGRNVSIDNPSWVSIGNDCWIDDNVSLIAGPSGERPYVKQIAETSEIDKGELRIGDRTHVANGVLIQAHGGVLIQGETTVASGSRVYSLSHHYRNLDDLDDETAYVFGGQVEPHRQYLLAGPVVLGRGCAVGLQSVVLPGARLGSWSWLACGSVFSGSSAEGVILRGNPARMVKVRPGFANPDDEKPSAEWRDGPIATSWPALASASDQPAAGARAGSRRGPRRGRPDSRPCGGG